MTLHCPEVSLIPGSVTFIADITGVTQLFHDGQVVLVDGLSGTVTMIGQAGS